MLTNPIDQNYEFPHKNKNCDHSEKSLITIRFTCGDTKILSNIKMSQNIMTRIVKFLLTKQ